MNRMIVLLSVVLAVTGCMSAAYQPPEVLAAGGIVYPTEAQDQKIEGYVKVAYDVNVDGSVSNAHVVEAVPPGVFDAAALAAVRSWRFRPAVDGKKPIAATNLVSRVKFRLGESEDYAR